MLEEVWEQALRVYRLTPLPVRFVCFLCVVATVISELLLLLRPSALLSVPLELSTETNPPICPLP